MTVTADPIVIDCAGSHAQGIAENRGEVMCPMCGHWFPGWDGTNELPGHRRLDILAMLARGDFE
jgi:hypothetical protein